LLRQEEKVDDGASAVSKGTGETGADTTRDAGQMGGLPRGHFGVGLTADKGPKHEANGQRTDK